jgi:uracil-DNA glycosylase
MSCEIQNRSRREILYLLQQTRDLLSFHRGLGIEDYPKMPALENFLQKRQAAAPAAALRLPPQKTTEAPGAMTVKPAATSPAVPMGKNREPKISMAQLRQETTACQQCSLAAERQAQVVGEGTTESGLLIVVDMPSASEQGADSGTPEQCAGKAGKRIGPVSPALNPLPTQPLAAQADELLTKMLAAIGLQRRSVYITPLFKCLPARPPAPGELQKCLAVLRREVAAMAPQIICTMGPLSAGTLLGSAESLFKLRGRFHRFLDVPLMPTFHPAYLLRNPELKKAAWHDLQAIQKRMQPAESR